MTTVVLVCLYLASYLHVYLHERGHALALLKHGFRPEFLAVGVPIPFLWGFYLQIRHPRILDGVPIRLYPLLFLGRCKIDRAQTQKLTQGTYLMQAEIVGAGVWANLFFTLIGTALFGAYLRGWRFAFVCLVSALLLWLAKKWVCMFVIPLASLVLGYFLLPGVVLGMLSVHPNTSGTIAHNVGLATTYGLTGMQGVIVFLFVGGLMIILNLLPLVPADSGLLISFLLSSKFKRAGKFYAWVTLRICIALVAYSMFLEGYAVFAK